MQLTPKSAISGRTACGTKRVVRKCPLLRRLWGLSGHLVVDLRVHAHKEGRLGQHPAKRQSQRANLLQPVSLPCPELVERFFNKIQQCRRIATRYDMLAANYLVFVQLASIRLWLRVNEFTP